MLQRETGIIKYLTIHPKRRQEKTSHYEAYLVIKNLNITVNLVFILSASMKSSDMQWLEKHNRKVLGTTVCNLWVQTNLSSSKEKKITANFQDKTPRLTRLIRH